MLSDSDKEKLVTWLLTKRNNQIKVVSLGALAQIIEDASLENGLESAQQLASSWLNEVANREREVPLRVHEPEAGLQSSRILKVPGREIKGQTLVAHLMSSMELIDISKCLVRKLSLQEALVYCDDTQALTVEKVFPQGSEGDKAFRIDKVYSFQSSDRNKEADSYDCFLIVDLTRCLKDYLISHLWVNIYKVDGENFKCNPQTKYEGNGYSIVIPKDGWRPFWERVEVFKVIKSNGEVIKSFADIQKLRALAAHQQQLKMFHADADSTKGMGRPTYIN